VTASLLGSVPPENDLVVEPPPGVEGWSENFFFHPYDHVQNIGLALHMGRSAQDPWMWREIIYVYLPDGQALAAKSFGRRETPAGPTAANLSFECLEPFQRWHIRYDGAARPVRADELLAGPLADGPSVALRIDVEVESLTPVWAANTHAPASAEGSAFGGAFGGDNRFHYEQVTHVTGTIIHGDQVQEIDATGFRDHTRGIRKFGGRSGHTLLNSRFPDGFSAGLYEVRSEDGTPQFRQGFTVDDGVLHDVVVVETPKMESLTPPNDFTVVLDTVTRGRVTLRGEPLNVFPQTICTPNDIVLGLDRSTPDNFSCFLLPSRLELHTESGGRQTGGGHLELSLMNSMLR
jgi:hypothetical protein